VALGKSATWTSPDGRAWTLVPGPGIGPLRGGGHVAGLAQTPRGFLAIGYHVSPLGRHKISPLAWTSVNGLHWQRLNRYSLHLPTQRGAQVLRINHVAARGGDIVITGAVVTTRLVRARRGTVKHLTTTFSDAIWHSVNGGVNWERAHPPAGSTAAGGFDGVAATSTGFVAIQSAAGSKTGPAAVAYISPGGAYWNKAAAVAAAKQDDFHVTAVGGSDQGVVVAGQIAGGTKAAYVSADGRSWKRVANLGSSRESLAGATVTTGETVAAGGAAAATADGQQPYLVLAGTRAAQVSFGAIAGTTGPALGIHGIAAARRALVAVGTANGAPAIWTAARPGRWTRVSFAALDRPAWAPSQRDTRGSGLGRGRHGSRRGDRPPRGRHLGEWISLAGSGRRGRVRRPGRQIAAGRAGYVIVGRQAIPARTITQAKVVRKGKHVTRRVTRHVIPGRTIAAAWWSAGLTGWVRAAGGSGLDGPGTRQMLGVASGGPGFVAVGSAGQSPAAWTTSDGKRWRLISLPIPAGATSAVLQEVAAPQNVSVATGTASSHTGTVPLAEFSDDGGSTWHQTPMGGPGGAVTITALTTAGRGFEAAGTVGHPGNQQVVIWSSRNGATWTARKPAGTGLNSPGQQAITALAAYGSTLTGVGYLATPAGEEATVWKAAAASG